MAIFCKWIWNELDFAKCAAKLLFKEGSWRYIPRKMEAAQLAVFYCEVLQQLQIEDTRYSRYSGRYFLFELFADAAIEKVIAAFL